MDLKLLVIALILQIETAFAVWRSPEAGRIRIYLDDQESLIIPKHHSEVKILNPLTYGDKLFEPLPKINKKPLKYAKYTPLKVDLDLADDRKKCCGNKWTFDSKEVSLEELIRPVLLPAYKPPQIHGYENFDDVKPVTEIIEGDLKYDFRTQTHSYR